MTRVDEILQFVKEDFLFPHQMNIDITTDLCKKEILGKNEALVLVSFLEERYNIRFKDEEMLPETLSSIEKINSIIEKKISEVKTK